MATITLKQTLSHWARLFGYVLGVAVVGGAVAGGGLAVLEDVPNWAPGGAAPDVGVNLVVGAGLLAVGALVLLAGFFTIVLVVVATGVEAAGDDADGDRSDGDSTDDPVPDPAERLASRRRARRGPTTANAEPTRPQERAESRSAEAPAPEQPNENERSDATDRGEDWMREVERDLVEGEGADASQTPPSDESTVPPHATDPTDRSPEDETGAGEERVESSADDWVGADEIGSDDPTADVADEPDVSAGESGVPAGDRPSTASDGPVDDAIDATDRSTASEDASGPAGRGRETTDSADDPLAPDDFEPDPVENDREDVGGIEEATAAEKLTGTADGDPTEATADEQDMEATDVEADSDGDSTDSDDEPL
ncbi:hypothetical protein HLRTI_002742 [Halorhabdus tiamatea SARL4B]|uniref:Uncharacterized protein n=1 Tax=Halorhabdus tiamatea SARL4B TaxID=1033806 RepID=U2F4Q5_9EURY|nr:hypothetical protein [Halorhabdus tiamatea]ERJ05300.1 hypothetical protein HLRTI_002742 [Halorhabdus tiamatea SARL4B]